MKSVPGSLEMHILQQWNMVPFFQDMFFLRSAAHWEGPGPGLGPYGPMGPMGPMGPYGSHGSHRAHGTLCVRFRFIRFGLPYRFSQFRFIRFGLPSRFKRFGSPGSGSVRGLPAIEESLGSFSTGSIGSTDLSWKCSVWCKRTV